MVSQLALLFLKKLKTRLKVKPKADKKYDLIKMPFDSNVKRLFLQYNLDLTLTLAVTGPYLNPKGQGYQPQVDYPLPLSLPTR